MKEVGAFEAKTHFSQLLVKISEGERIIITRHGHKVAMLVPINDTRMGSADMDPKMRAINAIKMLRRGHTLGPKLSIRSMREEGRK